MLRRKNHSQQVKEALRDAESIMPPSGDINDLLEGMSRKRERPLSLLRAPLGSKTSGLWIATKKADYIAVAESASPERLAAIVCHEIAHILLGHEHEKSVGQGLLSAGLLKNFDPELADSIVAARTAYSYTVEADAERVATLISIELRRRDLRGGHTFYDELWR